MTPRSVTGNLIQWLTGRRLLDPAAVVDRARVMRSLAGAGQLSAQEARHLGELVRRSDPTRPIIEIGTLFGSSTLAICLFKDPAQQLITVDNYSWNPIGLSPDEHFKVTTDRLAALTVNASVVQVRAEKGAFYRSYDGPPPSLFFCDADHSLAATREDLAWAQSVRADIICGDDYSPGDFPGVVEAVMEFGGAADIVDQLFVLNGSSDLRVG